MKINTIPIVTNKSIRIDVMLLMFFCIRDLFAA